MDESLVSIEVLDESGTGIDVKQLARLSRFVMDRMRVHPLAELCIKVVDEDTIASLNEQWMEKSGPTDVLASLGPFDPALHQVAVLCYRVARARNSTRAARSSGEGTRCSGIRLPGV